jgi:hypothetical protein
MTGYGADQHKDIHRSTTEPSSGRYPNREWERKALEDLIVSLKAHPDLADKLYAVIKQRP